MVFDHSRNKFVIKKTWKLIIRLLQKSAKFVVLLPFSNINPKKVTCKIMQHWKIEYPTYNTRNMNFVIYIQNKFSCMLKITRLLLPSYYVLLWCVKIINDLYALLIILVFSKHLLFAFSSYIDWMIKKEIKVSVLFNKSCCTLFIN